MGVRQLFWGELLGVAEFECPPGDCAWRDVNVIGSDVPLVVFPRIPVAIRHLDSEPVLATPNLVMLYNPGQLFQRELRHARGDEALLFQLRPPALQELERECRVLRNGSLATTHAPSSRVAYLHQHLLARYLRGGSVDPLVVEESAARIVRCVIDGPEPAAPPPRRSTRSAHHELAENAKEIISASLGESASLQELAARLGTSPFHLARVFRRETGFSLHRYRTQLRLRSALQRLPASSGSLTALAIEHGFASHSHFTDTFRREFGLSPSTVRNGAQITQLLAA
jgi:AraC family transcriptional regulator